jgi:hypothetical protein
MLHIMSYMFYSFNSYNNHMRQKLLFSTFSWESEPKEQIS